MAHGETRGQHATLIPGMLLALALSCWSPLAPAVAAGEPVAAPGAATEPRGNRLASESSPFLLQHADNPVDWYPWGEEALSKAREENKLIFLSVGYSTCYWCHVMEREVFSDAASAARLNAHFVSIMVDSEERPDLDRVYMPVRLFTTGQTGWPLSVILTPDLEPLFAAGYLPNQQFRAVLEAFHRGWTTEEARYRAHAGLVMRSLERAHGLIGEAASHDLPDRALLARAAERYAQDYDPLYGGFGEAPKFPLPAILEMLMALYERGGHDDALAMVAGTLQGMARGGIRDHLGGGFHRYAVDRAWRVPHFEKMLYDNAQLLHAYARAYRLTGKEVFRRTAEGIAGYVGRAMTGPSGLFHSAEDSETEGEEGAYYLWRQEELQALLSEQEFALAAAAYGVAGEPTLNGAYVLHRTEDGERQLAASGVPSEVLEARLEAVRRKLLEARGKRQRPFRDDKAIASWNGLMIEAFAYAGLALEREDLLRRAERAARALLQTLVDGEGLLLHVARQGQAKGAAYLDDYAAVILGLTELYRGTGNAFWRAEAARLADQMIDRLHDQDERGFSEVGPGVEHLIVRPRNTSDEAVPAGNSLAVRALNGLAALGLPRFASPARQVLSAFAPTLAARPDSLPYMLWGLEQLHRDAASAEPTPAPRRTADVVRLAASIAAREGGSELEPSLVSELQIDDGWHVNANPASFDFLIPTTLSAAVRNGGPFLDPTYPSASTLQTPLGLLSVYDDATQIRSPLPAGLKKDGAAKTIELRLEAQACNEAGICLPPDTLEATLFF